MTTVAFVNGNFACDSRYTFPINVNGSDVEKLTALAKTTLFNSNKYERYKVPKAIKFIENDDEVIVGVSSEARFFALTLDHFQHNYGNIVRNLNPQHPEYIISELSGIYNEWYTGLCNDYPDYSDANPANEPFLYLIVVVNGVSSVFHYLPERKQLELDPDDFPAIGTGRNYVKEYLINNPDCSVVDAVSFAISRDEGSGFPIFTDLISAENNVGEIQSLFIHKETMVNKFYSNLDAGIALLNNEVSQIKTKINNFQDFIRDI